MAWALQESLNVDPAAVAPNAAANSSTSGPPLIGPVIPGDPSSCAQLEELSGRGVPPPPRQAAASSAAASSAAASSAAAVAPASSASQTETYAVKVPNGVRPGGTFAAMLGGRRHSVTYPVGAGPGSTLHVQCTSG